jgi:hypothetical protein
MRLGLIPLFLSSTKYVVMWKRKRALRAREDPAWIRTSFVCCNFNLKMTDNERQMHPVLPGLIPFSFYPLHTLHIPNHWGHAKKIAHQARYDPAWSRTRSVCCNCGILGATEADAHLVQPGLISLLLIQYNGSN